jgi:hypothetical protein
MWKAAVIAYFEVIFRNYPGGTEENHFSQVGRCLDEVYHVYQSTTLPLKKADQENI